MANTNKLNLGSIQTNQLIAELPDKQKNEK